MENDIKGCMWKNTRGFNLKIEGRFYVVVPVKNKTSIKSLDFLVCNKTKTTT